jgi:hypothetical protein
MVSSFQAVISLSSSRSMLAVVTSGLTDCMHLGSAESRAGSESGDTSGRRGIENALKSAAEEKSVEVSQAVCHGIVVACNDDSQAKRRVQHR